MVLTVYDTVIDNYGSKLLKKKYAMKIIDFHTHIFPPRLVQDRSSFLEDEQLYCIYREERARLATLEDLLGYMDEEGVNGAVAMGFTWQIPRYAELHNRYLAEAQENGRKKIWSFGSIALEPGTIQNQVKMIHEMGLAGIGEISFYREGMKGKSPEILATVLAEGCRYNLPVCIHVNEPVGHLYSGKYSPDIEMLYQIITQYREIPVILSHWGGGLLFYELMKEVQRDLSHVYYDMAATPFLYNEKIYRLAVDICGGEKLLFGTDFPLLRTGRYIDPIERMVTDPETRNFILHKNAFRILGN